MSFFHLAACMVIALRLTPKDPQLQDATALGLGCLWHLSRRIVGTTAIRCLGATQEPFRFTAMPRLEFFQAHALPFPCQNSWGVRGNGGYVNVACGASHTTAVQF